MQLLNAAAGVDCSKDCEDMAYEAFLLMTKHSDVDQQVEDVWGSWEGQTVKLVPPVETADTLRSMQVNVNLLHKYPTKHNQHMPITYFTLSPPPHSL